ncbi:MAG: hypothetical protein IKO48_07320 [Elusimicrobia bacterium]|nr:hypothetical protein [Elusimicrobiota bacterium]
MKCYSVERIDKVLERMLSYVAYKTKIKRTPFLDNMLIRDYIVTQKRKGNIKLYETYLQYIKNKTEKIACGMSQAGGMDYVIATYQFDFDVAKAKLDVIEKYKGEKNV